MIKNCSSPHCNDAIIIIITCLPTKPGAREKVEALATRTMSNNSITRKIQNCLAQIFKKEITTR